MKNPSPEDIVYNSKEREEILVKMETTIRTFYGMAASTGCHPFIEFCGLMGEYLKSCQLAHLRGLDFTQANRHSGQALSIETYQANYIGEKLGCIYGPTFSDPEVFGAFLEALGLPFDVQIIPRGAEAGGPDDPMA